ncbi:MULTISPECIES: phosphoribosylglycinamide formyltransferase [unclassified Acinetobacter]|uniref:phosphoribosylglycinamide formyltransferase n=1 Tax=unclassified Acinetobacter TaxID=196816 RepID=UPI0035B76562
MRIAVLVSGSGSNLQALIDAQKAGQIQAEIVGVLSNKSDAYALQRAKNANIDTAIIQHQDFPTRASFDAAMHQQLIDWQVDIVILAGFMRILSGEFVTKWQGKMLNIHPSLLPAYKGMHTHQRVLDSGDVWHGCTVHFVTAELDAGQAIVQGVLKVSYQDDVNSLSQRVHQLEHLIYPQAVAWLCNSQLKYINQSHVEYQKQPLNHPIQFTQL